MFLCVRALTSVQAMRLEVKRMKFFSDPGHVFSFFLIFASCEGDPFSDNTAGPEGANMN